MDLLGLSQAELPYCEYAKQGQDKRQQEVLVLTDRRNEMKASKDVSKAIKSGNKQQLKLSALVVEPMIEYGTHIRFVPAPPKSKTLVWWVVNNYDDGQIGWIGWYAAWQKYSFFVKPHTVYEWVCLREIAAFCEHKTQEHKQNALDSQHTRKR